MKQKLSMACIMLLLALSVRAGTYNYLTVLSIDGTCISFPSNGLQMQFADGSIIFTPSGEASQSFSLENLSLIRFSETDESDGTASSIEAAVENDLEKTEVSVYTPNGAFVGTFSNLSEARTQLSKGLYLVKGNGKTIKIVRR